MDVFTSHNTPFMKVNPHFPQFLTLESLVLLVESASKAPYVGLDFPVTAVHPSAGPVSFAPGDAFKKMGKRVTARLTVKLLGGWRLMKFSKHPMQKKVMNMVV